MEGEPTSSWPLWLDLWAQSVRLPEVAGVRQKFDERWREIISSLVLAGQEAGEFGPVDAEDFAVRCPRCWTGWRSRSRWTTRRWTLTARSS